MPAGRRSQENEIFLHVAGVIAFVRIWGFIAIARSKQQPPGYRPPVL
jgi:hypothetical protein